MTALGQTLALLCTAGGLVVGLVVVIATREGLVAVGIALEFWTAAGLLRLSGAASWRELAAAAAIVGLRQLLNLALGTAPATTAGENLPGPRARLTDGLAQESDGCQHEGAWPQAESEALFRQWWLYPSVTAVL